MRRIPFSTGLIPPTDHPSTAHTLTSALQSLFRPWRGWRTLLRYRTTASGPIRIALSLAIPPLALLDLIRYVLATLLALFAALLTVLIGASYLGVMLFAVLFSGLVGGASAVRGVPTERTWDDDRHPGTWP